MKEKIIIIVFIFIGIFLRLYQFGAVPAGLFSDEISIAVNSKTIAQSGVDEYGRKYPFAFESLSDYKMPGYIYLSAVAYKILGPSVASVRITALIASLISIFSFAYLAHLLFPKKKNIFLYTCLVVSLCLFHIHFSRIAYETMLATMWLSIFLIGFWKVVHEKIRLHWVVITICCAIFSMWSYYAPRFIIPLFSFGYLFYLMLMAEKGKRLSYRPWLIVLAATVIAYLPTFFGSKIDNRPLSYLMSDTGGGIIASVLLKARSVLASFTWIFNLEFLFDKGDQFAFRHGTKNNGVFMSIFLVPYILGLLFIVKNFALKNKSIVFICMFAIVAGLPSSLTSPVPYAPRLLPMVLPLTLLISLGIVGCRTFLEKTRRFMQVGIIVGVVFLLIYQILVFSHLYFVHFAKDSQPEFSQASVDLGKYIAIQHASAPENNIYYLNGKSCHNWGHDDLYLWYYTELPNKELIAWNNLFRDERYKESSPFDAYDHIIAPSGHIGSIFINLPLEEVISAPKGSLIVRCGINESSIEKNNEKIVKAFYMYPKESRELFYIVTVKL